MVHLHAELEGFEIKIQETRDLAPFSREDDWLIWPMLDRLRLAVIDGATSPSCQETHMSMSASRYAAHMVRLSLCSNQSITDSLWEAHKLLCTHGEGEWMLNPKASCVVADLFDTHAQVIRTGDCEARLLESEGDFKPLLAGSMLSDKGQTLYSKRASIKRFDQASKYEASILSDASLWNTHPIGSFKNPHFEQINFDFKNEELWLVSDGAAVLFQDQSIQDGSDATCMKIKRS